MSLRLTGCVTEEHFKPDAPKLHRWYAQGCEAGVGVHILREVDLHQTELVMTLGIMGGGLLAGRPFQIAAMADRICRDWDAYLAEAK